MKVSIELLDNDHDAMVKLIEAALKASEQFICVAVDTGKSTQRGWLRGYNDAAIIFEVFQTGEPDVPRNEWETTWIGHDHDRFIHTDLHKVKEVRMYHV
jgi:hypothetical protein